MIGSESESKEHSINILKNKYSKIIEKLDNLYKTHLKVLNKSEKNQLFIQILNNLKLPDLIKEKEKLKKLPIQLTKMKLLKRLISIIC